jgi:hypothetical protein
MMENRNFIELVKDFVEKFGEDWCNHASTRLVVDTFVDYVLTYED